MRRLERRKLLRAYGAGEGYSVRQVIETVERVTGRTVPVVESPRRPSDPPVLVAEAKKLKRLGWEPRYASLDTIVETAWRWHNAALELVPSSQNRAI